MRIRLASLLSFLAVSLTAGCLDAETQTDRRADDLVDAALLAADEPLWADPQLAPHPAFGWPTLTHVPAAAPAWWQPFPARATPDPVGSIEHLAHAGEGSAGDGIAVFGRLVLSPGFASDAATLFDLADPSKPVILSRFEVVPSARQAVFIPYPDGRLVAAFATDSGQVPLWDVTDPTRPEPITVFDLPSGGHTIAVVPGTPILYNANTVGSLVYTHELSGGRSLKQTEVYDLTDPANPVLVQEWQNGYGCHAISFHLTAQRQRAYCAAVDANQIWDIADPRAPRVITTIPMPHGQQGLPGYPMLATVAHWIVVNEDATVMAVADEFLGGGNTPACDVYMRRDGQTTSGLAGNVWFFDISDEEEPVARGWVNPGAHFTYNPGVKGCTAHIGRLIPQSQTDLLAMSFYGGGVALIDFTDPADPFIVDSWATAQPVDVWYANGYLVAGDFSGGIDVLTLG